MKLTITLALYTLVTCTIASRPSSSNFFKTERFKDLYGRIDGNIKDGDAGDPLIITDYLQKNEIEEAQEAAKVDPEIFLGVNGYSGYFRVDDKSNASLFFWFFPSQSNYAEDPVVLWLQGGPGSTSLFGLFQENGPFQLVGENQLNIRNTSWTKSHSVIYIDQPVGTGFSFTNGELLTNQTQVGIHLYSAMKQFFQLFPDLQSHEFFITGESYAGKYIPALAHRILIENPEADQKINLKGLAIGNGLSSPAYQLRYAEYLLQHGLIDHNTRDIMAALENKSAELIEAEDYAGAWDLILEDFFNGGGSVFAAATGFDNVYNYLFEVQDFGNEWLGTFVSREDVRKAIHVGNIPFGDGLDVYDKLALDIPKPVVTWVEQCLENYRVLIYNGQLDIIVPYPTTIDYVRSLNFSSAEEYKTAKRRVWYVDDRIAGYAKTAGNLTDVLVRNAGHIVPYDQPEWALDLITRFTRNKEF